MLPEALPVSVMNQASRRYRRGFGFLSSNWRRAERIVWPERRSREARRATRATDTKLKREVAIKVLPESLVAEPDRIAHFQGEDKALAALNHRP